MAEMVYLARVSVPSGDVIELGPDLKWRGVSGARADLRAELARRAARVCALYQPTGVT